MSEDSTISGFQRRKNTARRFIPHLIEEYRSTGCQQQAAALTYMTLFAIVPTMTVVFTMFSLFPAFDGLATDLQDFLFRYLLPESGLEIEEELQEFTAQARSLTLAGVGMLVVTAYMMIKNIERTFNRIWGVVAARRGLNSFLLYWAILSLGPLLLGVGVAISTYLLSLKIFNAGADPTGLMPILLGYFPWVLTTAAFTLLFAAVPNCKVPVQNALAGGVLTAIFFELFKDLFGWVVAQTSFTAVYGTFAMVPLFLLWIYVLWVIVLSGAVLVCALTNFAASRVVAPASRYPDLVAALLALWALRQCQKTGRVANDEDLMNVGVEADQWLRVRDALVRYRVITLTQEDEYVLCRDLSLLTLRQLADFVGVKSQMPGVSDHLQSFDWFPNVASRLLSIDQHTEVEFDVTIDELFCMDLDEQNPYPDEGEGLDDLREELDSYGSLNAQLPTATDLSELNIDDREFSGDDLPSEINLPTSADLLDAEDDSFRSGGDSSRTDEKTGAEDLPSLKDFLTRDDSEVTESDVESENGDQERQNGDQEKQNGDQEKQNGDQEKQRG